MRTMAKLGFIVMLLGCSNLHGLPPGAALSVVSVDIPDLYQGETSVITVTIENYGSRSTDVSFVTTLEVYEDASRTVEFCPVYTWTQPANMAPGSTRQLQASLVIAPDDPQGMTLYFVVRVDSERDIYEATESDNTMDVTAQILVMPPVFPDLTAEITFLPEDIQEGTSFWLFYTITNSGEGFSPAAVTQVMLIQPLGTALGGWADAFVPSLNPGQSYPVAVFLEMPVGALPTLPGIAFVGVFVDYLGLVQEADETNNIAETPFWAW